MNYNLAYKKYGSMKEKLMDNVKVVNECWELDGKPGSHGYIPITYKLYRNTSHRVSYETFKGKIPKGSCVLHKCDNRKCCNPEHLFLGDKSDNIQDCIKKKRVNPKQKLTLEQTIEIKLLCLSGKYLHKEISEMYKVSRPLVSYINLGKTRKRFNAWRL